MTTAAQLDPARPLTGDVCIVGAGPAGITIALGLADAGHRVVLLESGGRGADEQPQRFNAGDTVGEPHYPLDEARVRGFGGTSLHWFDFGWFRGRPFEHLDFEQRSAVPYSGWPIDRAELDPFYERAMSWCGLGRYDYGVQQYVTDDRPELPWVGDTFETAVFKLSPPPIWRERYDRVASHDGIELVLGATATAIETEGSTVRSVRFRPTAGGPEHHVQARRYVLALGGLENPRMLLLSRSAAHPNGLGNDHDKVGRFFMEHPRLRAGTIVPSDPELPLHTDLYDARPSPDEDDVRIHGKLALRQEHIRDEGLLNACFFVSGVTEQRGHPGIRSATTLKNALTWRPLPAGLGRHAANAVRATPAVAAVAAARIKRRRGGGAPAPQQLQLEVMGEQAPNPDSRVVLGSKRDPFGLPLAQLDWRVSAQELRSVRRQVEILEEVLVSGGHGRMRWKVGDITPIEPWKGGWHHMGTTRMDPDATEGVVDVDGRVHGVDELYVAGSSVFPTAGYANPTLTLVALAVRLADHLDASLT